MRWLVTGAGGMLGSDLVRELAGREVTALTRADLDVTDAAAVRSAVAGHDVVVNLAAYTRVDDAETEVAAATAVNATGARLLAEASAGEGARLVQVSTDYVFDGTAREPYDEAAPVNPLSVYGATKAEGERLALAALPSGTLVLRTAWLYGAAGPNFVRAVVGAANTRETVAVTATQFGQPTWTVDVARRILEAVDAGIPSGIYHATNSGEASRYDFAREAFRLAGLDPERVVLPVGDEILRPAPRPDYSVLGHGAWSAVGLPPLRPWREALAESISRGLLDGLVPAAD